jgi:hypothetical protein
MKTTARVRFDGENDFFIMESFLYVRFWSGGLSVPWLSGVSDKPQFEGAAVSSAYE